ncbi:MAG: TonB-dependent receptor [Betaproteobacteria bacterium]|nr:TonB-dependent receptor [Betaproteobacteria bacterium]MCL2162175.1 TonB-dependent receptor [Betaproteobacteria bacterium]
MRISKLIAALACASALTVPALAQENPNPEHAQMAAELAALREQIAQMQSMYERRIVALEERLAGAGEAMDEAAPSPRTDPQPVPQSSPQTGAKSGIASFNPEISLILQGAYTNRKKVEERYIGGFVSADHYHDGHGPGDNRRGFTLDHTELVFAASIDPYWRGQATVAVLDGEVELEEAWFQTTALGHGTGIKAGRFRSGIGYLNEQHAHQWDFFEQPLMYKALFGGHGYAQDGVQLKWVAPLPVFLELGAEIGRGQNFPGNDRNTSGPNSRALFAHVGSDIGASNSWRAGLSWFSTRARGREGEFETHHGDEHFEFTGRSRVWIADFVYKWAPDGNSARRNFKFQAEYFRRAENGDLVEDHGHHAHESLWRTRQSGFYLAGVYQFTPNWRAGLRYDRLSSGRQNVGDNPLGIEIINYRPNRISTMVDYSWSEFSRLRLQWSRDRAMPGVTDNQVTLQYIMSLGSHGAHKF